MEKLIILDTETTGIDFNEGHRVIEIGCVEVVDREITSKEYHQYIQPDRMVGDSFDIHAISDKFLIDKPRFAEIADEFIEFIRGNTLVIHNAPFDVGFLDNEFKLAGKKERINDICEVIDSLEVSKKQRAGGIHNLNAICRRYNIDTSSRVVHGALLDAQILAKAYLALTGGQFALFNEVQDTKNDGSKIEKITDIGEKIPVIYANDDEIKANDNYFASNKA
jgi:DNA polymerase-3 subunit epsilon